MKIDYARCYKSEEENVNIINFSYYSGLSTKEWSLSVEVKDGQAIKILSGDTVRHGGWYDWDEVEEESDLLELVNQVYQGKLGEELSK